MDSTKQTPRVLSSIFTVVLLIVLPFVGIILVWTLSRWNTTLKIISTVLGALWVLPCALFMFALFYTGGSIKPFLNQDQIALGYLKERYGKDFEIVRDLGGDSLGGPITYSKRVALKEDRSVEFSLNRCLARCTYGTTRFIDSYPSVVWSKQVTQLLQSNPGQYGIPDDSAVTVLTSGVFTEENVWMLAENDTGVVAYNDIMPKGYNPTYSMYISLSERNPNPTNEDFLKFASTIVNVRNSMRDKSLKVNRFTATLAPREQSDESGWRFYVYRYTSPGKVIDDQSVEEIASQFKKDTFSDITLYNQINGR